MALRDTEVTPERWKRTEELFYAARALAPGERAGFLAGACGDDDLLRHEVESLLNEPGSDDGFLATPVLVVPEHIVAAAAPAAMAGRSLGGYQLQTLLGAGGMGEVYRALDTALGRDVAIKVLPSAFTSDPDRLSRFEREARMLAALNHPNICAIYGVDEADGIRLLVLELVEGETLSGRLARVSSLKASTAGLPLRDALGIARQIADALEVAHDKGIVHRDLKPANVKITPDGVVKVLDFGLAKAVAGDGSSPDLTHAPETTPGEPQRGAVVGTAAYMSPEQARGLPVDKRTDIWAFGCVLYEMLTGLVTFPGDTVSDSIAKILEREPNWSVLPATTPASIRRLLLRCLVKDPKRRLRDIGDVRMEIDAIDEVLPGAIARPVPLAAARSRTTWLPWVALVVLAVAVGTWEAGRAPTTPATATTTVAANPLATTLEEFRNARFSHVTDWVGTEELPEISPDGESVAFLADKDGQFDVWAGQLGLGNYDNLTHNRTLWPTPANLLRYLGFSGDGLEIWYSSNGNPSGPKLRMPLSGGKPYPFLPPTEANDAPSWSPANGQLVYFDANVGGDPLFLADRTGANAHPIDVPDQSKEAFFREGMHNHNPVWSLDGKWIYFVRGTDPFGQMEVWRMRPSGESPKQLTRQNAPVNYLTPLDTRTLLYVARAEDWSGPWLWALDVETGVTQRVTVGQEIYTYVSASRNGRVVATVARPTAKLWSVRLDLNRLVEERDAQLYDVPTVRALAPRFSRFDGTSLFYLAGHGTGDGLFRRQGSQVIDVRQGATDILAEPPVPSPDGSRVAVVVRRQGKRRLAIMSADGTGERILAPSIDIEGGVGQGTADWSPNGNWIVTGGNSDVQGQGLFMIPVDGVGEPVRLVEGRAQGPVWSPKGDLIVYATTLKGKPLPGGRMVLRGVRPDRSPVEMPEVQVRVGGAHRFLPNGTGLVYLGGVETNDFWLIDLVTRKASPLTSLSDRGFLNTFDITPDGKSLVFDRSRQNSDVVLIDLKRSAK